MRKSIKADRYWVARSKMSRGLRSTAERKCSRGEMIVMKSVVDKNQPPVRAVTVTGPGFRNRGRM